MSYREIKHHPKAIYRDKEVSILEETCHCYFIYLKNFTCGYVVKEKCKLIENDQTTTESHTGKES